MWYRFVRAFFTGALSMICKLIPLALPGLLMAVSEVNAAPQSGENVISRSDENGLTGEENTATRSKTKNSVKESTQKAKTREKAKQKAREDESQRQQSSRQSSKKRRKPQPYEQGYMTLGFSGGTVRRLDDTQFVIGGSFGYFILDGLELSGGVEAYLFGEPTTWTVTPGIRYVIHQLSTVNPYLGAFYRYSFVGEYKNYGDLPDLQSIGARAGISIRTGSAIINVGGVYERYIEANKNYYKDNYEIYPEISFGIAL